MIFNPNKCFCFAILILNILVSGLGTFIIGFKNCSFYDFILGIIQFFICYFPIINGIRLKKKIQFIGYRMNSFMFIYLIIIGVLFYLSSIYTGIFHNFIFFNPRTTGITGNKQKGSGVLLLNLITGGLGTIVYGFIINNIECFNRIKIWLIGIIQIFGFVILITAFSLIGYIDKILLIVLFFIGGMGYLTSICIGMRCYKTLSIS